MMSNYYKVGSTRQDILVNLPTAYAEAQSTEDIVSFRAEVEARHIHSIPFNVVRDDNYPAIPVSVVGDAEHPPNLEDCSLTVSGQDVHLQNMIMQNELSGSTLIQLAATRDITLQSLTIYNSQNIDYPPHTPLLSCLAKDPVADTVRLENCLFLGNQQLSTAPLVKLPPQAERCFNQLHIRHSVFLGNDFAEVLDIGAVAQVHMTNCVIHATQVFMAIRYLGTRVFVHDCILIGKSVAELLPIAFEHQHPIIRLNNCLLATEPLSLDGRYALTNGQQIGVSSQDYLAQKMADYRANLVLLDSEHFTFWWDELEP